MWCGVGGGSIGGDRPPGGSPPVDRNVGTEKTKKATPDSGDAEGRTSEAGTRGIAKGQSLKDSAGEHAVFAKRCSLGAVQSAFQVGKVIGAFVVFCASLGLAGKTVVEYADSDAGEIIREAWVKLAAVLEGM